MLSTTSRWVERVDSIDTYKENNILYNRCNNVDITGIICAQPQFSHSHKGKDYYKTKVCVKRDSGVGDFIPVMVRGQDMKYMPTTIGRRVQINGEWHSFKEKESGHLTFFLLANIIRATSEQDDKNLIYLKGFVRKDTIFRITPSGRRIADLLLEVPRTYGKSDLAPCITWGSEAYFARTLLVGEEVELVGRIQSRHYFKRTEAVWKTAYEISCMQIRMA